MPLCIYCGKPDSPIGLPLLRRRPQDLCNCANGYIFTYDKDSTLVQKPFGYATINGRTYTKCSHRRDAKGGNGSFARYDGESLGIKKSKENIDDLCEERDILRKLWPEDPFYYYPSRGSNGITEKAYLTMPYCEGLIIDDYITKITNVKNLPFDFFIRELSKIIYLLGILVDYIHKQGYSHNDIKGDNIIVKINQDGTYYLYLIDYGSALNIGYEVSQRKMKLYNNFAPPEFFIPPQQHPQSFNIDSQHDVYSIGTMFLRAIATFEDQLRYDWTPEGLRHKINFKIRTQVLSSGTNLTHFPDFCNKVITRCAAEDPTQRMTVVEFTNKLGSLLARQFKTQINKSSRRRIPMGISATFDNI